MTYYWSVRSSLPSRLWALFNRARSLLLSSLSISFSVANVGSNILVLGLSSRVLDLLWVWLRSFEHAQIIGKEAWHKREHVLFSHACTVSQTGHTDRRTHGQTNFRRTIKCGARSRSPPIMYYKVVARSMQVHIQCGSIRIRYVCKYYMIILLCTVPFRTRLRQHLLWFF